MSDATASKWRRRSRKTGSPPMTASASVLTAGTAKALVTSPVSASSRSSGPTRTTLPTISGTLWRRWSATPCRAYQVGVLPWLCGGCGRAMCQPVQTSPEVIRLSRSNCPSGFCFLLCGVISITASDYQSLDSDHRHCKKYGMYVRDSAIRDERKNYKACPLFNG